MTCKPNLTASPDPRIRHELEQEKRNIQKFFNHRKGGFFIEVGANDPCNESSQTYHLEKGLQWQGILIEPLAELFEGMETQRPLSKTHAVACTSPDKCGTVVMRIPVGGQGEQLGHAALAEHDTQSGGRYSERRVEAVTLDSILQQHGVEKVDFISIDVEGGELDVLRGFNLKRYRPGLILIEDHLLHLRNHRHLRKNGYKLIDRTGHNNWYVPCEDKGRRARFPMRLKLFKKMYLSIWIRKFKSTLQPEAKGD